MSSAFGDFLPQIRPSKANSDQFGPHTRSSSPETDTAIARAAEQRRTATEAQRRELYEKVTEPPSLLAEAPNSGNRAGRRAAGKKKDKK